MTKAQKIREYINSVHCETQHPIDKIGDRKVLTYDNARQHGFFLKREHGEKYCENDYICKIARKMGWKVMRGSWSIILYHDNKLLGGESSPQAAVEGESLDGFEDITS